MRPEEEDTTGRLHGYVAPPPWPSSSSASSLTFAEHLQQQHLATTTAVAAATAAAAVASGGGHSLFSNFQPRATEMVINGTTWYTTPPPYFDGSSSRNQRNAPSTSGNGNGHEYGYGSFSDGQTCFGQSGCVQECCYGQYKSMHYDDSSMNPYGMSGYGGYPGYGSMPYNPYDATGSRTYNYSQSYHQSYNAGAPNTYSAPPTFPDTYHNTNTAPFSGSYPFTEMTHHPYVHRPVPCYGKTMKKLITWHGLPMSVTVTSQASAVNEWIQQQAGKVFGLDIEWKPNRNRGEDNCTALLQLCGGQDCLIVQLLYLDMKPPALGDFLSDSNRCFGGVGIKQDIKKLEKDHGLICQKQVELGVLASEKLQRFELRTCGLKKLVSQVLKISLIKAKRITMSNWEKEFLDEKQIEYACLDAWSAYLILQELMVS